VQNFVGKALPFCRATLWANHTVTPVYLVDPTYGGSPPARSESPWQTGGTVADAPIGSDVGFGCSLEPRRAKFARPELGTTSGRLGWRSKSTPTVRLRGALDDRGHKGHPPQKGKRPSDIQAFFWARRTFTLVTRAASRFYVLVADVLAQIWSLIGGKTGWPTTVYRPLCLQGPTGCWPSKIEDFCSRLEFVFNALAATNWDSNGMRGERAPGLPLREVGAPRSSEFRPRRRSKGPPLCLSYSVLLQGLRNRGLRKLVGPGSVCLLMFVMAGGRCQRGFSVASLTLSG